VELSNQEMIE